MKTGLLQAVLLGVCLSSAGTAAPPNPRVSISATDADVRVVLRAIFSQARVPYSLAPEVEGRVSAGLRQVSLKDALHAVLKPLSLSYRTKSGKYYVTAAARKPRRVAVRRPGKTLQTQALSEPPLPPMTDAEPAWMPDNSAIWNDDVGLFNGYLLLPIPLYTPAPVSSGTVTRLGLLPNGRIGLIQQPLPPGGPGRLPRPMRPPF